MIPLTQQRAHHQSVADRNYEAYTQCKDVGKHDKAHIFYAAYNDAKNALAKL
jgi:hypothetical protein